MERIQKNIVFYGKPLHIFTSYDTESAVISPRRMPLHTFFFSQKRKEKPLSALNPFANLKAQISEAHTLTLQQPGNSHGSCRVSTVTMAKPRCPCRHRRQRRSPGNTVTECVSAPGQINPYPCRTRAISGASYLALHLEGQAGITLAGRLVNWATKPAPKLPDGKLKGFRFLRDHNCPPKEQWQVWSSLDQCGMPSCSSLWQSSKASQSPHQLTTN